MMIGKNVIQINLLADLVEDFRIKNGLSIRGFSKLSDCSINTIQKIRRGENVTPKVVKKIFDVINVPLQDLVNYKNAHEPTKSTGTSKELVPYNDSPVGDDAPTRAYFAHPKPLERYWVGRNTELARLTKFYKSDKTKAVSIVGFGGLGKSALVRHWLEKVDEKAIFWWSFYREPDMSAFLAEALKYFSNGTYRHDDNSNDYTRVRNLLECLSCGRFILVLDGLDSMQNINNTDEHFGKLKEDAFIDFMRSCVEVDHQSFVLMTTRYPLKDLEPYEKQGYNSISLGKFTPKEALRYMRKHGIKGEDKALDAIARSYDYHVLSLELIADYLKKYYDANIKYISQIPFSAIETDIKIAQILAAYDMKLKPCQQEFMSIISAFRRPVEDDAFVPVFRSKIKTLGYSTLAEMEDFRFRREKRHLVDLSLINEIEHPHNTKYSIHPLIQKYYYENLENNKRIILHMKIAQYYMEKATPDPKNMDDLSYTIEAFHHTIQAKDYKKAYRIYRQLTRVLNGSDFKTLRPMLSDFNLEENEFNMEDAQFAY